MFRKIQIALLLLGMSAPAFACREPERPPITKEGRLEVIRTFDAEIATVKWPLPAGKAKRDKDRGGAIIDMAHCKITPEFKKPKEGEIIVQSRFFSRAPGQKARITYVRFTKNSIILETDGGLERRNSIWKRIQIGAGTASTAEPEVWNHSQGSQVAIVFKDHVPEFKTPQELEELKLLLSPVLDFSGKSAAQMYVEHLPAALQAAIKNHKAIPGMDKALVKMAMGNNCDKIGENGYEEWIYGKPPAEVTFVRFPRGIDMVERVEVMQVDGTKTVATDIDPAVRKWRDDEERVLADRKGSEEEKSKTGPPTLCRPGEQCGSPQ